MSVKNLKLKNTLKISITKKSQKIIRSSYLQPKKIKFNPPHYPKQTKLSESTRVIPNNKLN